MQLSKKLYRFWNETRRQQQKTDVNGINMAISSLNKRVMELENQNQNLREFLRLDKDKLPLAYDMATSLYAEDGARRQLLLGVKTGAPPTLTTTTTTKMTASELPKISIPLIPSELRPRSVNANVLPFNASALSSIVLKKGSVKNNVVKNNVVKKKSKKSDNKDKENRGINPKDLMNQRSKLNRTRAPLSGKKRKAPEPTGFLASALALKFQNANANNAEEESEVESDFEWSAVKTVPGKEQKKVKTRSRLSLVGGGQAKKRRV